MIRFISKCSTLKNVCFWELATDIYIRIIVKSYSLIIGNGYSDRSRAPNPISFLQEPYFRWWRSPVFSGFKSSLLPDGPLYSHILNCYYIIVLWVLNKYVWYIKFCLFCNGSICFICRIISLLTCKVIAVFWFVMD